jgi:hypothetical protein
MCAEASRERTAEMVWRFENCMNKLRGACDIGLTPPDATLSDLPGTTTIQFPNRKEKIE